MLIHELCKIIRLIASFLSLLVWPLYLLILSVEWYNFTWSHSMTHTHTHTLSRTSLDVGLAHLRDLYLTTDNTHKTETSMPPAGSNLQSQQVDGCRTMPWPCGHLDWWLIIMCVYVIPVWSSSKSSSVHTSVLLQQLSSSTCDSAVQHRRGLHHCSSGSDSPPNSLLVTNPTECSKRSTSPDSSSTSSANSHSAGQPDTWLQLTQKNQLYKLNSAGNVVSHFLGLITMLRAKLDYLLKTDIQMRQLSAIFTVHHNHE